MKSDVVRVFVLHHTITRGDVEDCKLVGIYESKGKAEAAVARLKDKPGFRDSGGTFDIGPCVLNMDYWADGFGPA